MIYISDLREKLGFSPKKCIYKLINGEIIIYSIDEKIKNISA
jgi:hypothetical protein